MRLVDLPLLFIKPRKRQHYLGVIPLVDGLQRIANAGLRSIGGRQKIFGVMVKFGSKRLKVFLEKGTVCVECGIKGNYFAIEECNGKNKHYTVNLYHLGRSGGSILMTADHIKPRAKGGRDTMANLQPMCANCNNRKGDGYGGILSSSLIRQQTKIWKKRIRKQQEDKRRRDEFVRRVTETLLGRKLPLLLQGPAEGRCNL